MQSIVERHFDDITTNRIMEEDSENDANDDLYLSEVNNRSLSELNRDSFSCKISCDSLTTEVTIDSATETIKDEPSNNAVSSVLVPVRDPLTKRIKNMYVPVEVKDETGLNIIKSVLIPIKDDDGTVSYEIKKVVVPINPERILPKKKGKALQKMEKSKSKQRQNKRLREEEAQGDQNSVKTVQLEGKDENERRAPKDEVDQILETLRNICPLCQKRFNNEKQMDRHIRRKHKNRYRCKKCHFSYASEDALEKHMKTHEKDTYVKCPFCHLKYKRMSGLTAHQIREHSTVDPKCSKDSKSNCSLEHQKANQSTTKSYVCQYCDNAYPQKSYLVAHERIAHGVQPRAPKKLQCSICKKNFATERTLRRHTNIHTNSQSFLCAHCGKEFANKYSLELHTRMHTGERPYQCKVCLKSFSKSITLRVHTLIHTGRRPYICDICGRGFTQRGSMMTHRRKHPGNHPPVPPILLGSLKNDGD